MSHLEKLEKVYSDADSAGFIKALRKGLMQFVCRVCGHVSRD